MPETPQRALIVDDDYAVRGLLSIAFERANIDTDVAESGREAMELLRRNGEKYCCVLLDLNIPPPNGSEIARFVTGSFPELPIIIVSGHPELAEQLPKMNIGASIKLILMKPVNAVEVARYVHDQCAAPEDR
jgi:DNA-binding NtrC family response regulator